MTATATIIAELAIIVTLAALWLRAVLWSYRLAKRARVNAADAAKWRNARDRRKAGRR